MSIGITEKDMAKVQRLLRQVFLVRSDISEIEEKLGHIKNESAKLYEKLDNIADGENQGR